MTAPELTQLVEAIALLAAARRVVAEHQRAPGSVGSSTDAWVDAVAGIPQRFPPVKD